MAHSALSNKQGYSLIEMLVALAILAIVAVALMQSSLLVIQKNSQNELRDEAVRIGEQTMNAIRSSPGGFDATPADAKHVDLTVETLRSLPSVTRTIRGGSVPYNVLKTVTMLDAPANNNKQVTVTVNWSFRNQQYSHSIVSIVRR